MSNPRDGPKIGAGHAAGMARQGLKELREIAAFSGSSVAQPTDLGIYGSATPGEIADVRRADKTEELEQEPSTTLSDKVRQATDRGQSQEREPPEKDRD